MSAVPVSCVSARVSSWTLVDESSIDISFLARAHRRRLSRTVQLALTAYHECNPEHESLRSVYASRYGEYTRTFGILQDIAKNESTSPAAFSVSVHNTPSGIASIGTANTAPSSTVAANAASFEAGFLEAALQYAESPASDILLIGTDEPLPELYATFSKPQEEAYAFAARLSSTGDRRLALAWQPTGKPGREPDGIGDSAHSVAQLLLEGSGSWSMSDGRLDWEWTVESA